MSDEPCNDCAHREVLAWVKPCVDCLTDGKHVNFREPVMTDSGEFDPKLKTCSWPARGLWACKLLPIAARRRALMPVLRRWRVLLAFAVAEIVLPWYALNAAEVTLPSSTTGLLLASIPLVAIGVAFLFGRRHRVTVLTVLGLITGTAGVAAVVVLALLVLSSSCTTPAPVVLAATTRAA